MPIPSQGHYGFHSFPVVDWFCLFVYLWVLTFPLLNCSEFGNCVITLIDGGNRSTRRQPLSQVTDKYFITQCCIAYTSPWTGFEPWTLVVIGTTIRSRPYFVRNSTENRNPDKRCIHPCFYTIDHLDKYKLSNTADGTSGEGSAYPSCAPEFTSGFYCGSCCAIFSFLSDVLSFCPFFFLPLHCLSFDSRIQITPFVYPTTLKNKLNINEKIVVHLNKLKKTIKIPLYHQKTMKYLY